MKENMMNDIGLVRLGLQFFRRLRAWFTVSEGRLIMPNLSRNFLRYTFLLSFTILISNIMGGDFQFGMVAAHAMVVNQGRTGIVGCPSPGQPSQKSMLVVLLDRSSSLRFTDPNEYSASVTKILADLWPGSMAVVLVVGGGDALQYLGPETLSNPDAQQRLKDEIEQQRNQLGAYTPLGKAIDLTFELLSQNGFPAGSRAILITDGLPSTPGDLDGKIQAQDIEQRIIPEFCSRGIPINTFGLGINPGTSDGYKANQLLTNIAAGTGASYTNVQNPEELAKVSIDLYAQWQHLNFLQVQRQINASFPIPLNSFARKVTIITFRSSSSYPIALNGPDGAPIQDVQRAVDEHYVIDNLVLGEFVNGTYVINTGGDPDAQVYLLIESTLHLRINNPTSQTLAYIGRPIQIEVILLDGTNILNVNKGQATLVARSNLIVNGEVGPPSVIKLQQQGEYFRGMTPDYILAGEVQIEVEATYEDVRLQSSVSLRLLSPQPPPVSCQIGAVGCFWLRYQTEILAFILPLVLLVLLLVWISQPSPFGWLCSKKGQVELGTFRTVRRRLLHKSIISSKELEDHPNAYTDLRFDLADFVLIFKRGERVYIRETKGNNAKIMVIKTKDGIPIPLGARKAVELEPGSIIIINGRDAASFELSPKPRGSVRRSQSDRYL